MLKPIDQVPPSSYIDPSDAPIVSRKPLLFTEDTIATGPKIGWNVRIRQSLIGIKEKVISWAKWIWEFFLFQVLFFMFDRRREEFLERQEEMGKFVALFAEIDDTNPASILHLREKFEELTDSLQDRVKKKMAKALKMAKSDKTPEEIIRTNLFHMELLEKDPGKKVQTYIFYDACLRVSLNPLEKIK